MSKQKEPNRFVHVFLFIVSFAHLYPIEHRFLDNKIKFTALSALLHLPRLESDGSLLEPYARYEKKHNKKI